MVRPLGAQPQARAVRQPEPAAFGLFGGDFQPLAPPDPLDPLVIDDPARCRSQQLRDLPIAIAAILPGQFDDVGGQPLFVVGPVGLRRCVDRCCPSTRQTRRSDSVGSSNMINAARRREGLRSFAGQPRPEISL